MKTLITPFNQLLNNQLSDLECEQPPPRRMGDSGCSRAARLKPHEGRFPIRAILIEFACYNRKPRRDHDGTFGRRPLPVEVMEMGDTLV